MSKPILGYWDIRGLAEPIRLLLSYAGVKYEDKRIKTTPLPVSNKDHRSEWTEELKPNLGLDFPNLPYYIDGDLKLTQTLAILRYLARKYDLVPKQDPQLAAYEMFEGVFMDYKNTFNSQICYSSNYEKTKAAYLKQAPTKLKVMDDHLKNKTFIMGDKVSYLDFLVFECFDVQRTCFPDFFDNYDNISKYVQHMENLEQIKSYRSSPKFHANPINYTIASWGSQ